MGKGDRGTNHPIAFRPLNWEGKKNGGRGQCAGVTVPSLPANLGESKDKKKGVPKKGDKAARWGLETGKVVDWHFGRERAAKKVSGVICADSHRGFAWK